MLHKLKLPKHLRFRFILHERRTLELYFYSIWLRLRLHRKCTHADSHSHSHANADSYADAYSGVQFQSVPGGLLPCWLLRHLLWQLHPHVGAAEAFKHAFKQL